MSPGISCTIELIRTDFFTDKPLENLSANLLTSSPNIYKFPEHHADVLLCQVKCKLYIFTVENFINVKEIRMAGKLSIWNQATKCHFWFN